MKWDIRLWRKKYVTLEEYLGVSFDSMKVDLGEMIDIVFETIPK